MSIVTEREELIRILTSLRPGLGTPDYREQSTHFIFTGEDIATYNPRVCISYPFKTDFNCSVWADSFFKILNKLMTRKIRLEVKGKKLKLSGKRKEQRVKGEISTLIHDERDLVDHLIKERREEIGEWKDLPKDFLTGINMCLFSASRDATSGQKICLAIEGESIYSTDEYRVSKYKMSKEMSSFLVPAMQMMELVKFDVNQYYLADRWAHFRTPYGVIFSTLRYMPSPDETSLPQMLEPLFEDVGDYEFDLPDKYLRSSIDSVAVLCEEEFDVDKIIDVEIKEGRIFCQSKGELGWLKADTTIEGEDIELKFGIPAQLFLDILKRSNKIRTDGKTKALFQTDNFQHLLPLQ